MSPEEDERAKLGKKSTRAQRNKSSILKAPHRKCRGREKEAPQASPHHTLTHTCILFHVF